MSQKVPNQLLSRKYRETSGFSDPRLDTFGDVRRALDAYLLQTCPKTAKASQDAKLRHKRRMANREQISPN